jgi:hypothetical protein
MSYCLFCLEPFILFVNNSNHFLFFAGSCIGSFDVHVHWHILFLVQDWNADVLLINSKTDQLSQLAYDLLVIIFLPSPFQS